MNEPTSPVLKARSCDGCTMCCKLLRIEALEKPRSKWCSHCDIGTGCKIFDERLGECRDFNCGYLALAEVGDHWQPSSSKMVIALANDGNRLTIFVDPDRPDAWRKEPFYSDIKAWARVAAKNRERVVFSLGYQVIMVTPDGEIDLGHVGDGQLIIGRRKRGADGEAFEHVVVDRNDPVLDAMQLLKDPKAAKAASLDQLAEAKRQVDTWLVQKGSLSG